MQVSSSDFAVQDAELFLTEAKWHIVESTVEIDTNSRLTVDDSSFNFQNANFSTVDAKVHFESISLSLAPSTILRFGNCEIQNLNKSLEIKLGEDSSLTINWPYQSQDPSPTRIFCTLVGSISIPSGSQLAETDVAEMLKCDSKPFAETIVKATISEAYLSSFQAPINSKKVDKHVNECPIDFPTSTSVTKLSTTSSATIIFTQFSFYVLIILLSFTQNYQI